LGFQEFAEKYGIRLDISSQQHPEGFSEVTSRLEPGPRPSMLMIRIDADKSPAFAAIDVGDSSDPARRYAYQVDVLQAVDIYFKSNVNRRSLTYAAGLSGDGPKIRDLPFSFAVRPKPGLGLLANAFLRKANAAGVREFVDTIRTMRAMVPLSYFDRVRNRQKERDYTFLVSYYSHPDHKEDNDYRLELIRTLREDSSLNGVAAFASTAPIPSPYDKFTSPFVSMRMLLRMYATSRAAIYVRGLHDCLSFKLGQYLALGMPIAGQQIFLDNRFARAIPAFETQFQCATPNDIVRSLKQLLRESPVHADAIGQANLSYFRETVSPLRTAEYIVDTLRSAGEAGGRVSARMTGGGSVQPFFKS
jgi:hypothetical protein